MIADTARETSDARPTPTSDYDGTTHAGTMAALLRKDADERKANTIAKHNALQRSTARGWVARLIWRRTA